jgi:hypothetical protein
VPVVRLAPVFAPSEGDEVLVPPPGGGGGGSPVPGPSANIGVAAKLRAVRNTKFRNLFFIGEFSPLRLALEETPLPN